MDSETAHRECQHRRNCWSYSMFTVCGKCRPGIEVFHSKRLSSTIRNEIQNMAQRPSKWIRLFPSYVENWYEEKPKYLAMKKLYLLLRKLKITHVEHPDPTKPFDDKKSTTRLSPVGVERGPNLSTSSALLCDTCWFAYGVYIKKLGIFIVTYAGRTLSW